MASSTSRVTEFRFRMIMSVVGGSPAGPALDRSDKGWGCRSTQPQQSR